MAHFSRYLIWLGVAVTVAGIVMAIAVTSTQILAYGVIGFGVALLILGVGLSARSRNMWQKLWSMRLTQTLTNTGLSTVAILAVLVFVNLLAIRYPLRFDLTESQLYTLSSQSKAVVADLQQPLQVWVFQTQTDTKPDNARLLENYQRVNPDQFKFNFVNPNIDIGLAQKFAVQTDGEVYLEYGDKQQLVQTLSQGETLAEAQITNGMIRIRGDRQPHIYILQGHGEPPLGNAPNGLLQFVQAFEEQGYTVNPLNLTQTPQIPDDADVLALIAPQSPLLAGEVTLLQQHLQQQKGLLILLAPDTDPQLDAIFESWGIQLDGRVLIDGAERSQALGLGKATLAIAEYDGSHPITANLDEQISLYQFVRPISYTPQADIDVSVILQTDDQVWAESDLESPDLSFNPPNDLAGPLDFGIALERINQATNATEQSAPTNARIVVIGNATFATNGWFQQYINGDILLNSVNWLAQENKAPLAIRPKEPKNRRLNLTTMQVIFVGWVAPIIFPVCGLIIAITLWWRRR